MAQTIKAWDVLKSVLAWSGFGTAAGVATLFGVLAWFGCDRTWLLLNAHRQGAATMLEAILCAALLLGTIGFLTWCGPVAFRCCKNRRVLKVLGDKFEFGSKEIKAMYELPHWWAKSIDPRDGFELSEPRCSKCESSLEFVATGKRGYRCPVCDVPIVEGTEARTFNAAANEAYRKRFKAL